MKPRRDKPKAASNSPTFALSAPILFWEYRTYLPTYRLIKLLEVSWFSVEGFLFLVEGFLFLVEGFLFLVEGFLFFRRRFLGKSKSEKDGHKHGFLLVERQLSKLEKS